MRFMIGGRANGKTYASVQWLREDPDHRVIVAFSEDEAARLRREYNLTEKQVISFAFRRSLQGRHAEICVDNLDMILSWLFAGNPVRFVTATSEEAQP